METLLAGDANRVTAGGDGTGEPPVGAGAWDPETTGDWVTGTCAGCRVTCTELLEFDWA